MATLSVELPVGQRHKHFAAFSILLVFALISSFLWRNSPGDDLSSAYMACRLMASHQDASLYAHDPERFHIVRDEQWTKTADETGFKGFLHPYVQIPLWAAALHPLCTSMSFPTFNSVFVFVSALSVSALIFVSARFLAPGALAAAPLLGICLWLLASKPFRYTLYLTQSHPLVLLCVVAALMAAERRSEISAGLLLSFAAVIKLTPALLVVYWLATQRWRAILWFLGGCAALCALSVALSGLDTNLAYLDNLNRISNVLLVSYNNASLAAVIMAPQYPAEVMDWRMLPLPLWLKILETIAALALIALAGMRRKEGADEGAMVSICLIAMTAFAPIAWTHYYVMLIVPVVWLIQRKNDPRAAWGALAAIMLLTLNYPSAMLSRAPFYAAMIALVAGFMLPLRHRRLSTI